MSWLHLLLFDLAWPAYECTTCVGQEPWRGCYCQYHGAEAPCLGPSWARHNIYRPLWSIIARRCGDYDPGREYDD